jgi:hypothetical protein
MRDAMNTTTGEMSFSEDEQAFFDSEVEPIDACDLPFETWRERLRRRVKGLLQRRREN